MEIDAYIKFGDREDDEMLPLIEGDSSDEHYYWWCELRGRSDFGLNAAERTSTTGDSTTGGSSGGGATGSSSNDADSRPTFGQVDLEKRFDWASTQLFRKCCEAAEARTTRSDDDQGRGRINRVSVELRKAVGEQKITFLIVRYYGVKVVDYRLNLSGPEPKETITIEFEKLDFEYQQTDPLTGLKRGGISKALGLENHLPRETAAGDGASGPASTRPARGAAPATAARPASGAVPTTATAPAGTAASAGADDGEDEADERGSTAELASATESAASANFPGLSLGTDLGVLPN